MTSLVKIVRLIRLKKIVALTGFSGNMRAKIRIGYLVVIMVVIIHWVTCYYFLITQYNYLGVKENTDKSEKEP